MKDQHVYMDKHGRLLIPSSIRNALNFNPGDTFIIRTIDNELHLMSLDKAIENAQALLNNRSTNSYSLVDEFLELRKSEISLESTKFSSEPE